MIKSIQQFQTEGIKKLEKVMVDYSADMTKIAEMVQGVTKGGRPWTFHDCGRMGVL